MVEFASCICGVRFGGLLLLVFTGCLMLVLVLLFTGAFG